ncbi:MAG: hypothetical protein MOGMAGMI_01100 [Candidatus Omnitrophica bacterium]|nr:hypothetical protein [Candidatus Omnitrophota bacterium]
MAAYRRGVLAVLTILLVTTAAQAAQQTAPAQKQEKVDLDKDGRKETTVFYENNLPVRAESDKNNDGKADLFTVFRAGKKVSSEADRDQDGRIDQWKLYDDKGRVSKVAEDASGDGKPDKWKQLLQGTVVQLKEEDRNHDGRVDRRVLQEFKADKRILVSANPMRYAPAPGYVTLWKEEDTDYDGDVDVFTEKGNPEPDRSRIGRSMGPNLFEATQGSADPLAGLSRAERNAAQMNERYGLESADKAKKA